MWLTRETEKDTEQICKEYWVMIAYLWLTPTKPNPVHNLSSALDIYSVA